MLFTTHTLTPTRNQNIPIYRPAPRIRPGAQQHLSPTARAATIQTHRTRLPYDPSAETASVLA